MDVKVIIDIIVQLFAAFMVTTFSAITLEAPRQVLFKIWPIGVTSYATYLFFTHIGVSEFLSTFYACFIASIMSQFFSRHFKAPVTMFYIPTFFIYVPGSAIYQTAFHFINGDFSMAGNYLVRTVMTAGAIALGVFMSDSIFEIYFSTRNSLRERREESIK
ncbi:threonine/serine exporter family protein [Aerococcaceae bacterium DSM 111176]|nr:threonine/serine exporter family protein [Aerococcaceae bacterium DSM 111176]